MPDDPATGEMAGTPAPWQEGQAREAPATSTTRSALAILAAIEDLIVRADADQAESIATILHRTRDLRAYQVDDLIDHLRGRADAATRADLGEQVDRLADVVMQEIPGEPSRGDEGAVDCAIRLLRERVAPSRFGRRVADGGVMGTIVRCPECGGSGELHDPDERPPYVEPDDSEPSDDDPRQEADRLKERIDGG